MEINFHAELVYTASDLSRFNNSKPTQKLNGKGSDSAKSANYAGSDDDVLFIPSEMLKDATLGLTELCIEKNRYYAPESYKTQGKIIFDHDFLYKSTDFLLNRANQLAQGMDARNEQFDLDSYIFATTALSFFSGNMNDRLVKIDAELNPNEVMNLINQLDKATQELASQIKSTGKADINALRSTLTLAGVEVSFGELSKIKDQFKATFDAYTQGNAGGETRYAKLGLAYSSIKNFASANFDPPLSGKLVGIFESHLDQQLTLDSTIGQNSDQIEKLLREHMDAYWQVVVKKGGRLPSKAQDDPTFSSLKDDPYYTASGKFSGTVRETIFHLFASISSDPEGFGMGFSKAMDEFSRLYKESYVKQGWNMCKLPQSYQRAADELIATYEKLGHGKHINTTI